MSSLYKRFRELIDSEAERLGVFYYALRNWLRPQRRKAAERMLRHVESVGLRVKEDESSWRVVARVYAEALLYLAKRRFSRRGVSEEDARRHLCYALGSRENVERLLSYAGVNAVTFADMLAPLDVGVCADELPPAIHETMFTVQGISEEVIAEMVEKKLLQPLSAGFYAARPGCIPLSETRVLPRLLRYDLTPFIRVWEEEGRICVDYG